MKTRTLLKLLRSIEKDGTLRSEIRLIAQNQAAVIRFRKAKATAKTRERRKLLRRKKVL